MLKSGYKYKYSGVNQERVFNKLSLIYHFFNLKKYSKTKGEFCLPVKQSKQFEKDNQTDLTIDEKKGFGILYYLSLFFKIFSGVVLWATTTLNSLRIWVSRIK